MSVDPEAIYRKSDTVVVREIAGEFMLIPGGAEVRGDEEELITLNSIGRAIWNKLDGRKRIGEIVEELASEFEADPGEIENDVSELMTTLLERNLIGTALR